MRGIRSMSNVNKAKPLPSVEYLEECIDYNPDTGAFFFKIRPLSHFEDGKHSAEWRCKQWNGRNAGQEAGCVISKGYRKVVIDGANYAAHRLAWKMVHGVDPTHTIDHINGVRADNRACNLREATMLEQKKNQALYQNNTSGYIGVYAKGKKKWLAQGKKDGKKVNIGTYSCVHEAGRVAKEWRVAQGYSDRHGSGLKQG